MSSFAPQAWHSAPPSVESEKIDVCVHMSDGGNHVFYEVHGWIVSDSGNLEVRRYVHPIGKMTVAEFARGAWVYIATQEFAEVVPQAPV